MFKTIRGKIKNFREKKNITILGEGVRILPKRGPRQTLSINDAIRTGHLWGFGTTRSGKTKMISSMVEQDIRKGYSVAIIDPKGDHDLFENTVQVAFEEDRAEDLILVTPVFPDYSAVIDPLSHHYMIEELVGHIVSGVSAGKEPYFADVAYEISLLVVQAFDILARFEGRPLSFNLRDVKNNISRSSLEVLLEQVSAIHDPKLRKDTEYLIKDLTRVLQNPPDYFNKISNSLAVALQELTSGNVGKIIGKADENRFIKRLETGKRVIMIVQLGSMLTRRGAWTLGKVVLSMIQSFIGRRFSSNEKVHPPLCIYIDEAQNVLYKGIDDLFAKAGGADVYISGFCQSVSQLDEKLGKDAAKTILANTNTKIFLKSPDPETSEYASRYFGTRKQYSPFFSTGNNTAISARETEESVVKKETALYLKERHFLLQTYAGAFKGITSTMAPTYLKIKLPKIRTEEEL